MKQAGGWVSVSVLDYCIVNENVTFLFIGTLLYMFMKSMCGFSHNRSPEQHQWSLCHSRVANTGERTQEQKTLGGMRDECKPEYLQRIKWATEWELNPWNIKRVLWMRPYIYRTIEQTMNLDNTIYFLVSILWETWHHKHIIHEPSNTSGQVMR